MIDIKKMRLFPFYTNAPAFTKELDGSFYNIIFYPENSTFVAAYPNLKIQKRFVRYGTILPFKFPRIIVFPKNLTQFIANRIIPIRSFKQYISNLFIDTSYFLEKLDERYKKGSYRRPIVLTKIFSYLESVKSFYPGRKNVLIYYVDINSPMSDVVWFKRAWPIFMMFRSKEKLPFDYIMMAIQQEGSIKYYLLSNSEKQVTAGRFFSILKNLHTVMLTDPITDEDKKIHDFATHAAQSVQANYEIEETNKDISEVTGENSIVNIKTQRSIKNYVQTLTPEEKHNLISKSILEPIEAQKLAIKSTVYSLIRDKERTEKIVNSINPSNYLNVLKNIKTEISPEILEGDSYKNESRDEIFSKVNTNAINENKNPSKILNKRKVDFQQSFESDLKRSFQILETKKNFPLKMVKFTKQVVPIDPGDLEPTKMVRYTITLQDDRRKLHTAIIDIPQIQPDGTFLINGDKKYLIYQIIIDPIFFLKKGEAELQTMFATVATHYKKTKHKAYFNSRIAGYWIPAFLLLSYAIGFAETCKLFGILFNIVNEKPADRNVKYVELGDGKFIVFQFKTPESEILINSLSEIKGAIESSTLLSKEAWQNLLIKETGNRNSIFQINTVLDNIMEPIAVQILKTKLLPITFDGCIYYICKGLAEGLIYKRNDISKQRIRSSEVFNYQIQKLVLGSYNDYRAKREHGDKDAIYYFDAKQIVSSIVNTSRMIRPLENINPLEELASLTQITPIGHGGVSDINGITKPSRNINQSYFGNIDPVDTPENANVGVINHLTIDAAVGNVRGSFGKFTEKDIKSSVLSTSTAIIPFVSNDDGCRVMMGSSQTRQAIPILGAEKPLVQTGFETIMTSMLTDSYIRKSPVNGVIVRQSTNAIYVKDNRSGKIFNIPLDNRVLRSAQGKSSLNYFHSVVRDGQSVSLGQILAEGKHIQDGVITIGSNLLAAVMGWKGYSYDDGYIISERIASKKFVSTSYEEIVIDVKSTSMIKKIAAEGEMTKKGDILIIRSSKEVEELLEVEEDELVEGQHVKRSPGGKIISIEIYPNVSIKKFPALEPQFLIFKKRWEEMKGSFPEKFLLNEGGNKVAFSGVRIIFKIERYDVTIAGDKITNNHGGKGVITLVEKDENMPITPWGEPIDVIVNPIAIINRMNPGTLYELYTGLIAKFLAKQVVELGPIKTVKAMKLISDVYTTLDVTKDKALSRSLIKAFTSTSDKHYANYIKKIEESGYILPIIIPPFQTPTKEMIYRAMTIVGAKTAYPLILPEYKTKTKNAVAVGYLYYKKLEQQAEYKVSARSVGKYSQTTSQPIAGSAQGGGQRLGEFDTWAIASHGAEILLKELLGPLSDHKKTKDEILFDIIQHGQANYREPQLGTTKSRLDAYLISMMLDAKI